MSELDDMHSISDDRLKLLYHGSKMKIEAGQGNNKTQHIYDKCQKECEYRAREAAHYE